MVNYQTPLFLGGKRSTPKIRSSTNSSPYASVAISGPCLNSCLLSTPLRCLWTVTCQKLDFWKCWFIFCLLISLEHFLDNHRFRFGSTFCARILAKKKLRASGLLQRNHTTATNLKGCPLRLQVVDRKHCGSQLQNHNLWLSKIQHTRELSFKNWKALVAKALVALGLNQISSAGVSH